MKLPGPTGLPVNVESSNLSPTQNKRCSYQMQLHRPVDRDLNLEKTGGLGVMRLEPKPLV